MAMSEDNQLRFMIAAEALKDFLHSNPDSLEEVARYLGINEEVVKKVTTGSTRSRSTELTLKIEGFNRLRTDSSLTLPEDATLAQILEKGISERAFSVNELAEVAMVTPHTVLSWLNPVQPVTSVLQRLRIDRFLYERGLLKASPYREEWASEIVMVARVLCEGRLTDEKVAQILSTRTRNIGDWLRGDCTPKRAMLDEIKLRLQPHLRAIEQKAKESREPNSQKEPASSSLPASLKASAKPSTQRSELPEPALPPSEPGGLSIVMAPEEIFIQAARLVAMLGAGIIAEMKPAFAIEQLKALARKYPHMHRAFAVLAVLTDPAQNYEKWRESNS